VNEPARTARLRTPGNRPSPRYPFADAATISCLVTWSVRRNRTTGDSSHALLHVVESRRGMLATSDFRIMKRRAPQGRTIRLVHAAPGRPTARVHLNDERMEH